MIKVTVKLDNNKEDIRTILNEFWDQISYDLIDIDCVLSDDELIWYKIEVDEVLAGYYYFHRLSVDTMHIHVCIRPNFRPHKDLINNELKKAIGKDFPKEVKYLLALIPKSLPHVIVYALENDWLYLNSELSSIGKVFHMGIELKAFLEDIR